MDEEECCDSASDASVQPAAAPMRRRRRLRDPLSFRAASKVDIYTTRFDVSKTSAKHRGLKDVSARKDILGSVTQCARVNWGDRSWHGTSRPATPAEDGAAAAIPAGEGPGSAPDAVCTGRGKTGTHTCPCMNFSLGITGFKDDPDPPNECDDSLNFEL